MRTEIGGPDLMQEDDLKFPDADEGGVQVSFLV